MSEMGPSLRSSIQYVGISTRSVSSLPSSKRCIIWQCSILRWFLAKCSLLLILSFVMWHLESKRSLIWLEEVPSSLIFCFLTRIVYVPWGSLFDGVRSTFFACCEEVLYFYDREASLWYCYSERLISRLILEVQLCVTLVVLLCVVSLEMMSLETFISLEMLFLEALLLGSVFPRDLPSCILFGG